MGIFGRRTALQLLACGLFSAMGMAQSDGAVVNFQLKWGGSTYTGTGAYTGDSGTYWNAANGWDITPLNSFQSNVKDSSGTASSVTLALSYSGTTGGFNDSNASSGGASNYLTRQYLYARSGGTITYTIGGLSANHAYSIYLFGSNGSYGSDKSSFTINGSTLTTSNSKLGTFSWVSGTNYVVLNVVANASGIISGTMTNVTGSEGAFNGLQVVDVPEPATLTIVGGSATAALWLFRRRRA